MVYDCFICGGGGVWYSRTLLALKPDDRERLFERYEELLDQLGKPYAVISGAGELRTLLAIGFVEGIVAEGE